MNVLKRAWLYITRKKVKSIIILFILFAISTAVLSGISIKKAALVSKDKSKEMFSNTFELTNYSGIPKEVIKQIVDKKGIEKYSTKIIAGGVLEGHKTVEAKESPITYDEKFKDAINLAGINNTEIDGTFTSKVLKLVEGRHIVKNDKGKVLIHKGLAELNNLKVGDKINIKKSELDLKGKESGRDKITLEIIGIFDGENNPGVASGLDLLENYLICDNNSIKEFYGYNEKNVKYDMTTFYVEKDKELDSVISDIKTIPIDWNNYNVVKSEDNLVGLSRSFDILDKLVTIMLVGTIVIGVIVLSLILTFWIQGRIHETGILLAIGIPKFKIIAQYVIELLIIGMIGFSLSYFSGQLVAQKVGNMIVEKAGDETAKSIQNELGGFMLGNDPETSMTAQTVKELNVKVEFSEIIYVGIVGSIIIIVSVVVASGSIIRLKPKEILSKMS